MDNFFKEWNQYLINESKRYYEIDPKDPPSIRQVLKRWATEGERAYDEEKQPDGRYYHAKYLMTDIEPFLEYHWTREKGRNTPEEWDELKKKIETEGLKEPLMIEVGLNFTAKVGEGNHRFAIIKQMIIEKMGYAAYTRAKVPVRFIFKQDVQKTK
jgi:hypothetical protein